MIEQLLRIIAEQQRQIATLQARVTELEMRLGQNSQNSSRPPSSDPPAGARPAKRPPSGRRPGGQPGHAGHQRMLLPEDLVDTIVPVKPRRCRRCAGTRPVNPTFPRGAEHRRMVTRGSLTEVTNGDEDVGGVGAALGAARVLAGAD